MAGTIKIKRRIGGAQQAPGGANNEGELALFFPGAAGQTTKPTLYANDGGGWREVNPSSSPNVRGIVSTAAGGPVEAAFNAQTITVAAGDILIFTHPSTNGTAYVYTGPVGAPVAGATAAQFTALGAAPQVATGTEVVAGTNNVKTVTPKAIADGATSTPDATPANDASKYLRLGTGGLLNTGFVAKATGAEVIAGTENTKMVTALGLRGGTAVTPDATKTNDANKLVRLNAQGLIDTGFLSVKSLTFKNALDVTAAYAAPSPAWNTGDFGVVQTGGNAHASWAAVGITGAVKAGDIIIFDGTNYHVIANEADLSTFVTRIGANALDATQAMTWAVPAGAGLRTVLDGTDAAKSRLQNFTIETCVIDCGTY